MNKAHVLVAAIALGLGLQVSIAAASSPPPAVVGSYLFEDLGQGGWAGGPLYADGSVGGGGAYSFGNGQNVGTIEAVSWSPAGPSAVTMCFTDTAIKGGLLFPGTFCAPIPIGTPTKVSFGPGEVSILRVHFNHPS